MKFFKKIICYFKGHDFGAAVYISPSMLVYCRTCGVEIQDRTIEDLEPMTDEDYEHLELMEQLSE